MLRNRKHEEANKLKGVDLIDEETDLELGSFTHLENFIPAEIYSLKKKRGTLGLNSTGLALRVTEDDIDRETEDGDDRITE